MHRKYSKNCDITDQYYTKPEIAKHCITVFQELIGTDKMFYLELAAGGGSFSHQLHNCFAFDIEPQSASILKVPDSLTLDLSVLPIPPDCRVCSIGNPPFGRNAGLAKRFFNKSAERADYIAFIVPKTFRKASMVNRLDKNFHKIYEEVIPPNSFIKDGKEWSVPCIFQIWEKRETLRPDMEDVKESRFFDFVKKSDNPDFAIKRTGGGAGTIYDGDMTVHKEQPSLFIKAKKAKWKQAILEAFRESLPFWKKHVVFNTAAAGSISRGEIVRQVDPLICKKVA